MQTLQKLTGSGAIVYFEAVFHSMSGLPLAGRDELSTVVRGSPCGRPCSHCLRKPETVTSWQIIARSTFSVVEAWGNTSRNELFWIPQSPLYAAWNGSRAEYLDQIPREVLEGSGERERHTAISPAWRGLLQIGTPPKTYENHIKVDKNVRLTSGVRVFGFFLTFFQ